MENTLNSFKNRLFIFSFGLGLASTVGVFQPNQAIKEVSKIAIGFSIAGVAVGELVSGKAFTILEKSNSTLKDELHQKEKEANAIARNLDKSINDLATFKAQSEKAENELQQALIIIESRNAELFKCNHAVTTLQNKLKDVGRFSTDEAYKLVRDTYNRSIKKLENHIHSLMRNYEAVADDLYKVLIDVDKFKTRWTKKITEYESVTNFNELLDVGLEYQEIIINQCIELRVKGQTIALNYINHLLENSLPYSQYEQDIQSLQSHAGQTINQLKNEHEVYIRAIANDWVSANNKHIENYETNYSELIELGKQTLAKLAERDAIINQLQHQIFELENQVTELSKPWQFPGTIDYACAGNAIINFYHSVYRYTLDAIAWDENETGYTLTFATNRNKVYLTADMLEDKDNLHQLAGLTNSLSLPKFTPNYQSGLMTLTVQTRQAIKKTNIEKLEADISKIWVPIEKFESYVKNFERVRVTAGSTGGKSPTAKNLALAIMKARQGKGIIKLYDPQHGSKKDFWGMPKAGTSHDDNVRGVRELCELIDLRRNGRNHEFTLYVFDEVDNTVSNLGKKSAEFKNSLKIAIKEGSHCNIGAIFIGQSADANEIPGMTHSNWNNCVAVHIGSNAGIAIDKLTTITSEDKTRLLEQYRKIQDYCDRKNEELGLDIFTDATAYRFALVVPLNGLPKFIQLPDFDSYDYSQVMKRDIELATDNKSIANSPESIESESPIVCPHCGSDATYKNGRNSKGLQLYSCKDCDTKPKRWIY